MLKQRNNTLRREIADAIVRVQLNYTCVSLGTNQLLSSAENSERTNRIVFHLRLDRGDAAWQHTIDANETITKTGEGRDWSTYALRGMNACDGEAQWMRDSAAPFKWNHAYNIDSKIPFH